MQAELTDFWRHGLVAVLMLCGLALRATAAPEDDPLKTLKKEHPRLLLTDGRLKELKKLHKADPALQRYVADALNQADRDLKAPALKHEMPDGLRLLGVSRACLDRTLRLGLAWRWTGDRKYADQAIANLLAVCEFKDWNPRHFLDTAEMSAAVGIGYDWLYAAMDVKTRETVRQGLIRLGLQAPPGWGITAQNNWNMVCNGGLIVGSLAIAETDPEYARLIIPRAVKNLPIASTYYAPDGAWNEGPGYWQYATEYLAYAIAALDSALGNDFGLGATPGLDRSGWFPIYTAGPSGHFLCFADAGMQKINDPKSQGRGPMPVLFWLARKYRNPEFSAAENEVVKRLGARAMHVVWYDPPEPPQPRQLDRQFRGSVPVVTMRSAWNDPLALWIGVKGGFNRVNHGHLDLGNFELEAQGIRWALDPGSDNYNLPGYWDGKEGGHRWAYWRLNSESHNVLLIGGRGQRVAGVAPISAFSAGRAEVDLTSAYADRASRVVRTVTLNPARTAATITDDVTLTAAAEVTWGMSTDAIVTVQPDGSALLQRNGRSLRSVVAEPAGAAFQAVEIPEPAPPAKSLKGIRRLQVRCQFPAGKQEKIAIRFEPVMGK